MSIVLDILKELYNTEVRYKGIRVNLFGLPIFDSVNKQSLYSSTTRLKRSGYIKKFKGEWCITKKGKEYVTKKQDSLRNFTSLTKNDKKNLLVIFDIPEKQKAEREWFRFHLKKFGFVMVQRSVWLGPSPLPKKFVEYVKEIGIQETFKTFKLSKSLRNP